MPTYAYACTACDNRFEVHQSFTDDALTDCPECAGRIRKLFSSVGIVFKGSGFYRTDSRGGSTSTSPASEGSSSGAAKDSGSSSKDSGSSSTTTKDAGSSSSSGANGSGSTTSTKAPSTSGSSSGSSAASG